MAIGRGTNAIITLEENVLHIRCPDVHPDAHAQLEFQRTLRIPDDQKIYDLPAGLGRFPLRHVEDFSDVLDETTLRRGGVMMPMHRSEAMWINLKRSAVDSPRPAYPFAIKVSAGKINALTGGAWSQALSAEEQDYIVIPAQPWIDGFAISKGIIRQFVAERLGEGFSAEEQLTGKAEFGGLQIIAYPMKTERYMDILHAHEEAERARELKARALERRRQIMRLRGLISPVSEFSDRARAVMAAASATLEEIEYKLQGADEASATGDAPAAVHILAELNALLDRWNRQVSELSKLSPNDFRDSEIEYVSSHDKFPPSYQMSAPMESLQMSAPVVPMGLGGGGRMRQEIYPDPHGVDAWDQSAGSRCFVHLVNASQWAEVTGGPTPTAPPSKGDYEKRGLPWFDYYAPEKGATSGSKLLAGLKSWGAMYGKGLGPSTSDGKPPIQLGTAQRPSNVVSEDAGDD
jgi:hypothetical protein